MLRYARTTTPLASCGLCVEAHNAWSSIPATRAWMVYSRAVPRKHYLQVTDKHCGQAATLVTILCRHLMRPQPTQDSFYFHIENNSTSGVFSICAPLFYQLWAARQKTGATRLEVALEESA